MKGTERRRDMARRLSGSREPLKGAELASLFGVSRQVIVQDMALLRAQGLNVVATPGGYLLLPARGPECLVKTVVTRHNDYPSMEEELRIMVEEGATVLNVIVEHPLYGEIAGNLMISTPLEVALFMEKIRESAGEPLSSLTGGIHLHTLEVPDEEAWNRIRRRLREKNYLQEGK